MCQVGVDQGCPLSACGFADAMDPVTRFALTFLRRLLDDGAKHFAHLNDWYLWVKPQCLPDALALVSASTCSINLELQPSKIQVWRASCPDPFPLELLETVKPTLSCLGGHLHIKGDSEPRPVFLVNRPPWTRPHADSVTFQSLWLNPTLQASTRRPSITFSLPVNMFYA